jgi:hypothetical protein
VGVAEVLLVAKSSDFENADYLDIRPLLAGAGVHDFELIEIFETAKLRQALPAARLVILTSGVLGDTAFCQALNGELAPAWQAALQGDCSVLILSQLLFAMTGAQLPGVPAELGITAVVRPEGEPKSAGRLGPAPHAAGHQASVLPVPVDYARLNTLALESSLQGLYWHWWTPEQPELWRTIVTDVTCADKRGLVLEHAKSDGRSRIILSSIALDRIRDTELLTNLLQLCIGGPFTVGFIDNESTSLASGMMVSSLQRAGERVFVYDAANPADLNLAALAISSGIHDSLLIAPSVPQPVLDDLSPVVQAHSSTGQLRVIRVTGVEPARNAASIHVAERGTTAQFDDGLAQIRWQLAAGLIGQSIFDTAKVLRVFSEVDASVFDRQDWARLAADLKNRVRPDGTFESPAVPTAAFVYVASVILRHHSDTQLRRALEKSLAWLLSALPGETRSNLKRSAVYLGKAEQLGTRLPAEFWDQAGLWAVGAESPRDELSLLEVALERGDDATARRHIDVLLQNLDDPALSAPGDRCDLLMALTRASASNAERLSNDDDDASGRLSSAITRLANELIQHETSAGTGASLPILARRAAALELYSRTVAVPTAAIVGMLSSARSAALARQRWNDAVTFATEARSAVTTAPAEQKKLRRSVSALRYQQRFSRLLILLLAIVAAGSSVLLFYAVESDLTRLSAAWTSVTSNWGVLSGLITLSMSLIAWAVYAVRDQPKGESVS